jgi:hypothetical protein
VIIIQPRELGSSYEKELKRELLNMASKNLLVKDIDTILFHEDFPVDIRHNAKIYREYLAEWAEKRLR